MASSFKHKAAVAGRSVAAGIAGIANLPQFASNLGSLGGRYVGEKLRGEKVPGEAEQYAYPSEKVKELIDKLSGGESKPRGFGEKVAASALEFAGGGGISALGLKAAGKAIPGLLPRTGAEAASLAGAGAGSEIGQELLPESPVIGSLGGALLGGMVGKPNFKGPNRVTEEFLQREGKLGNAVPMEEAGGLLKKGASAYREYAGKQSEKLYGNAEAAIDSNAKVPLKQTSKRIDELLSGKTAEHEAILRDSPAGKLLGRIRKDIARNKGNLPYETANLYKDELSDLITTHGQLGNKAQGRLKHITSILDNEISSNLKSSNPKGYEALSKAKAFHRDMSERDRGIFNALTGEESGTGAFKKVLSDAKHVDAKKLDVAMKHLGTADREALSSSMINELGKNAENEFGLHTFLKNFKGLEPSAKKIVLSGLPSSSQAKFLELAKMGNGPGKVLNSIAGASIGASTGGPFGAVVGYMAAQASPKILPLPAFIDGLYRASKIKGLDKQKMSMQKTLKDIKQSHPEHKEEIQKLEKDLDKPTDNPENFMVEQKNDDVSNFMESLKSGSYAPMNEESNVDEEVENFMKSLR